MHLVQILLPVVGGRKAFDEVMHELTERFGGVTAYTRSPAAGLWKKNRSASTERDDIVVLEVMVDKLDKRWWAGYRRRLEKRLGQKELVVRAQTMVSL
jgi:hypothetical protein